VLGELLDDVAGFVLVVADNRTWLPQLRAAAILGGASGCSLNGGNTRGRAFPRMQWVTGLDATMAGPVAHGGRRLVVSRNGVETIHAARSAGLLG
jgi:hypothetical protein